MQAFPLRPFDRDTANFGGVSFLFRRFRFSEALPFFLLAGGLFPSPTLLPVLVTLAALALLPLRLIGKGTHSLRCEVCPCGIPLLLLWAALFALSSLGGSEEGVLRALLSLSPLLFAFSSDGCLQAGALATALAGALAVGEKLFGKAAAGWMDLSLFSALGGRAAFPFGNPNLLSAFLLLGLPLCLALAEERPRFGGALSLFAFGGILASLSRTAMLGAGCLLLFWAARRTKEIRSSRSGGGKLLFFQL